MGAGRKNLQDRKRHIRAAVTLVEVVRVFARSFTFLILRVDVIFCRGLGSVFWEALKFIYIGKRIYQLCWEASVSTRSRFPGRCYNTLYQVNICRNKELGYNI